MKSRKSLQTLTAPASNSGFFLQPFKIYLVLELSLPELCDEEIKITLEDQKGIVIKELNSGVCLLRVTKPKHS